MGLFLSPLKKAFVFTGRARRKEFLAYLVTLSLIMVVIGAIGPVAGTAAPEGVQELIILLVVLVIVVPNLALSVRRLHDSGLSGWWVLIAGIPVGNLVYLWMMFRPGTTGPNKFGSDPRLAQDS